MAFYMIVAGILIPESNALAIGRNNKIPWKIPEDLRWFYKYTIKQVVIMGRKTWESLPDHLRPLPGRVNIVLTRSSLDLLQSTCSPHHACNSIESVLTLCQNFYADQKCIVIGGAEIYKQFLEQDLVREISVTYIWTNPDISESCDTILNLDSIKDFKETQIDKNIKTSIRSNIAGQKYQTIIWHKPDHLTSSKN